MPSPRHCEQSEAKERGSSIFNLKKKSWGEVLHPSPLVEWGRGLPTVASCSKKLPPAKKLWRINKQSWIAKVG